MTKKKSHATKAPKGKAPKAKGKRKAPQNAWTKHVKATWLKNKGKKGYKFKDALKDAAKTYKKK